MCRGNPQIQKQSEAPPSLCPPIRYNCLDLNPIGAFFCFVLFFCLSLLGGVGGHRVPKALAASCPTVCTPSRGHAGCVCSAAGGPASSFGSVTARTCGRDFGGHQPHLARPGRGWAQHLRRCSPFPKVTQTWARVQGVVPSPT